MGMSIYQFNEGKGLFLCFKFAQIAALSKGIVDG